MVMQRPFLPSTLNGMPMAPTARPLSQQQALPVIQGPTRLNPGGSAVPSLGAAQAGATQINTSGLNNPLTGDFARLAGSGPQGQMLLDDPRAFNIAIANSMGNDPYAGLADLVSGAATTDQLNTLMAILGAEQDVPLSVDAQGNFLDSLFRSMQAGGGQQMPSISQVLGPAAQMGNRGDPNNPLYSLLTGGDPAQQAGNLLSAVMDLAGASGMNQLQARGLAGRLSALASEYKASQARGNAGGGSAFIDWLQSRAPSVSRMIFGA